MAIDPKIRSAVTEGLLRKLSEFSVEYYAPNCMYISRVEGFDHQYQLIFIEKYNRIIVEPDIGIRSHEVESLYHQWSGFSERDAVHTATIGGALPNIFDRKYEVEIKQKRDVKNAVETLRQWYVELGVPFFEENSSLVKMDEILNSEPSQYCDFAGSLSRESKGLIIARLLNRTDFEELCEIYDERIKKQGDAIYSQYWLPLVEGLRRL